MWAKHDILREGAALLKLKIIFCHMANLLECSNKGLWAEGELEAAGEFAGRAYALGTVYTRREKQCHSWLRAPYQKTHKKAGRSESGFKFRAATFGFIRQWRDGSELVTCAHGMLIHSARKKAFQFFCLWIHFKKVHNPKEIFDSKSWENQRVGSWVEGRNPQEYKS